MPLVWPLELFVDPYLTYQEYNDYMEKDYMFYVPGDDNFDEIMAMNKDLEGIEKEMGTDRNTYEILLDSRVLGYEADVLVKFSDNNLMPTHTKLVGKLEWTENAEKVVHGRAMKEIHDAIRKEQLHSLRILREELDIIDEKIEGEKLFVEFYDKEKKTDIYMRWSGNEDALTKFKQDFFRDEAEGKRYSLNLDMLYTLDFVNSETKRTKAVKLDMPFRYTQMIDYLKRESRYEYLYEALNRGGIKNFFKV